LKNILIDSTGGLTYGAKSHIEQVIKGILHSSDLKVTIISSEPLTLNLSLKNINELVIGGTKNRINSLLCSLFIVPIYAWIKNVDLIYSPWGGCTPISTKALKIVGAHHPSLIMDNEFNSIGIFIQNLVRRFSFFNADFIKSPSKSYADYLSEAFKIEPKKIVVIPHGVDIEFWNIQIQRNELISDGEKYFIMWSWFHSTKNLEVLIYAYAKYITTKKSFGYKLYLLGKFTSIEYEKKIKIIIKTLSLESKVVFIINPTVEKLISYINYSQAIILPFKYETFGYPYVESRIFDKPIAVANNLVSHEVTEGQCNYFNPNSVSDTANAFIRLQNMSKFKYKYIIDARFSKESEQNLLNQTFNLLMNAQRSGG